MWAVGLGMNEDPVMLCNPGAVIAGTALWGILNNCWDVIGSDMWAVGLVLCNPRP